MMEPGKEQHKFWNVCNQLFWPSVYLVEVTLLLYAGQDFPVPPNQSGEDAHVSTEKGEALQPDEEEGVVPLELQQVGGEQPGGLSKAPEQAPQHHAPGGEEEGGEDQGEEGEVPQEVLGSHHLIKGDEHEGLAEHTEVDLVYIAELVGENQEEHDL